ncbi:hypothetical protein [Methylobacterium aquaticum]|uniref:Uncharacterized protein n=1 Tax=Methylobacterium aquaticum TaxID=270351 RepID=A0A0C6FXJ7_9HYPH|nr:hypothetical protein [Methylobacterium aquaticum]BAQ50264.1 hypothetical protein Maq22A_3p50040 [Methylobacterium aquaticum]
MSTSEKGKFYLTGLGLLMRGVTFTPQERAILNYLCAEAAKSDAAYWDAVTGIKPGSDLWHAIEGLKKTLRSLGRQNILQAHYDRAADVHGPVPAH